MQELIIFDFDDTLVSTNPLFDKAKENFAKLMVSLDLYHPDLLRKVNMFDIALVKEYGYFAKACFPTAFVKTYEYYSILHKRPIDEHIKNLVFELGMWVFEQTPSILEDAEAVLAQLSDNNTLVLLTKGDEDHQKQKIISTGLAKYFAEYIIMPDKNNTVFQDIIKRHNQLPQLSWSVGNSIKADINPALQIGMNAIWVQGPTWDFEHEDLLEETYTVQRLRDIPTIIKL